MLILSNPDWVNSWVYAHGGGRAWPESFTALGWFRPGAGLTGGLVFYDATPVNCFVNIAILPGTYARGLIFAGLRYAFGQLGLRRLTFAIDSDNIPSISLVHGLGARLEATLQGVRLNGDTLIYKLSPEECKLWRIISGQEQRRTSVA